MNGEPSTEAPTGYVDCFAAAVPDANRERYIVHASDCAVVFREHGALQVTECWADDVPEGELTSFPTAVKRSEGESVVIGFVLWPSKDVRDKAWGAIMEDPRMKMTPETMPFDGKRLIHGGFERIVSA
ncbi:MAG: DUF1428 domain-containing protein [Pseudomonadota bacterium]